MLLLPLSDTREYLLRSWEFPGRTKKAELEGQKPHSQHWREPESPLALPCSAAGALVKLVCVLFQPLGSVRTNHDPVFNRFLSHTSPLSPVASHKHLLGLQRNLWSLCSEYVAFISLRITIMTFMLLLVAWNASGIRPQVSSDNGTQILKRNETPNYANPPHRVIHNCHSCSPIGSCSFPECRGGGTDLIRGGFRSKSIYVCRRQAAWSNAWGTAGEPRRSSVPQFPICKIMITFY